MLLVDTSVWIDFFNGRPTPCRRELHRLIAADADLAITGIILQEILQGLRSDLDYRRTKRYLRDFVYLPLREPDLFIAAAAIYRQCMHKGRTIRRPVDCLIATQAMATNAVLFHNDRDFVHIAAVVPLRLYQRAP